MAEPSEEFGVVRKMNAARAERPVEAEASADPQQQMLEWEHVADLDVIFVESPARRLQIELERTWPTACDEERWSPRRSLSFILITSALLWGALVWGVTAII